MSSVTLGGLEGLRALAHPARLQILDLLRVHEQLTATECAVRLKLSTKSCSYHLHVLAAQGLVVQGPALATDTRQRPWRRCFDEVHLPPADTADAPELGLARTQVMSTSARHDLNLFLGFLESPAAGSAEWTESITVHTRTALMTPAELKDWGEAVEAVTREHVERASHVSVQDRHPVRLTARGFPQTTANRESLDDQA